MLRRCANTPEPGPRRDVFMATTKDSAPPPTRTTRHHRVDYEFLGLLNLDFGIDFYSLNKAFMGVPPAPKKQAISLCEWALHSAKGDVEEAGRALRAWAKKNRTGTYDRRLVEAPEITYEGNAHERGVTGGGFLVGEGEYV
jgi:hypothetical protein